MKRLICIFVAIALCLCAAATLWAGQAQLVKLVARSDAVAAANLLKKSSAVRHYCPPCGDLAYREEVVSNVTTSLAEFDWSVLINGKVVDCAYVYVQEKDGQWTNLGSLLGFEVNGVPIVMQASPKDTSPATIAPRLPAPRQIRGESDAQNGDIQASSKNDNEVNTQKLGYVDIPAILNESAAGVKARQEFEVFTRQKQAELDSQAANLEKFKKAMNRKSSYEKIEDENTLRDLLRNYRTTIKQSQVDFENKRQELIARAVEGISLTVKRYGAIEKYGLILNKEGLSLLEKKSLRELVSAQSENTSRNEARQSNNDKGALLTILEGVSRGLENYNEIAELAKRQNYHFTIPATSLFPSGSEIGNNKKNTVLYRGKSFDIDGAVGVEDFDNITQDVTAFYDNKEGYGAKQARGEASEKKQGFSNNTATRVTEDWGAIINPDGQIFPSLVIATANLGMEVEHPELQAFRSQTIIADGAGLVDKFFQIRVACPTDKCEAKVVISSKSLMEDSIIETVLDVPGRTYTLIPKINWSYDTLHKIKQPKPASVVFELFLDGQQQGKKTKTVRVRSINDCPFYLIGEEGGQDMKWMFAAYVNEDHPWVDKILRDALNTRIVDRFTGYMLGNPDEVWKQVYAIWNVMQRYGIKYSSITATSTQASTVFSQHVRFLDESVNNAQANCVDGSALFASILRKIGIHPFLVLVPGHCFLGFYLDDTKTKIACLETTMMGLDNLGDFPESNPLIDLLGISKNNVSGRAFGGAVRRGREQYNKNVRKFGGDDPGFQLIDIDEARSKGIMPISFAGD